MENSKSKKIWVDGNTLVKILGDREADEYLFGNGYQAKLTKAIEERDKKIAAEMAAKQKFFGKSSRNRSEIKEEEKVK